MKKNGLLSVQEFALKIKEGGHELIDLMTPEESKEIGYIEGTTKFCNVYEVDINKKILEQDINKKYLLYCRSSGRSQAIYNSMKLAGFKNIAHLQGGIEAWKAAGYPVLHKEN